MCLRRQPEQRLQLRGPRAARAAFRTGITAFRRFGQESRRFGVSDRSPVAPLFTNSGDFRLMGDSSPPPVAQPGDSERLGLSESSTIYPGPH